MNKTTSINLGGFFFHIDEDAYQKLTRYFDAVKRSLSIEGRDEIINDIESRIAELFQERIKTETQVIRIKEIDEVIAIMGQPEDYMIDNEETNYSSGTKSNFSNTKTRRLYRDRDNAIFGGVASGFSHYFNIDPLWIRILFIISPFISFGTSLVIYLILWILIPEALTTSQKLEMKGEPINISNIEKKVKEGIDDIAGKLNNLDHEKIANTARNGASQIGSRLSTVFLGIFKIMAKIIGVFIIFFSSMALLGIIIASIIMIFSSSLPDSYIFNHIHTPIDLDVPIWLQGMLLLLTAGIPLLFILILGLKLLVTNMKSIGNYLKYSLLAIWIVSIIGSSYLGIKQATAIGFDGKTVKKEQIFMQPTDTLYVRMQYNNYYAKSIEQRVREKYTHDEKNNEIIYSTDVQVHFLKTNENQPFIQIEKTATGKSHKEATSRAEKIKYNFDIQGNRINLDNYFITNFKNKFRDQEVDIYIYLPKGTYLKPDKTIQNLNWTNHRDYENNFFDIYSGNGENVFKIGEDEAVCLNCEEEENDEEESESHIHIEEGSTDDNVTIKMDGKGLKIKSEDGKVDIQLNKE